MKFRLLDTNTAHNANHAHHTHHMHEIHKRRTYTDTYQYLDDLLDKTYLTDYFMNKSDGTSADDSVSPVSNK